MRTLKSEIVGFLFKRDIFTGKYTYLRDAMTGQKLRFIDLFAGIGGTRLAFEQNKCKCVFSSEWNKYAQITYQENFGEIPVGDITQIAPSEIPDHDILVGGFPCQPFSISGVSKKNSLGRPHGFNDPTQGTLFFNIKKIIETKQPKAFLLENVKNLKSHDKGRTFQVILDVLKNQLGYDVHYKVLDAKNYVPQHRERIFIVGFKNKTDFKFPVFTPDIIPKLGDILEKRVDPKYTLSDKLWQYLQNYARKHQEKGNGFGFGLAKSNSTTRTLSARYFKDGSEILIPQRNKNPRRLTPRECARLMGFPDIFRIPVSDTQAYRQFGNSVVVPLITDISKSIVFKLKRKNKESNRKYYIFIDGDKNTVKKNGSDIKTTPELEYVQNPVKKYQPRM